MSMRRLAKPICLVWPSGSRHGPPLGAVLAERLSSLEYGSAGTAAAGARSMPYTDFALSSTSTLLATKPRCPRCGETMQLVRLVPIPPHAFERTFKCPTCEISPAKEANGPLSNSTDGDSPA